MSTKLAVSTVEPHALHPTSARSTPARPFEERCWDELWDAACDLVTTWEHYPATSSEFTGAVIMLNEEVERTRAERHHGAITAEAPRQVTQRHESSAEPRSSTELLLRIGDLRHKLAIARTCLYAISVRFEGQVQDPDVYELQQEVLELVETALRESDDTGPIQSPNDAGHPST